MKLSIIISTYNSEEWLHKVLLGYAIQSEKDFEVVVADDGSTHKTNDVIDSFKDKFQHPILHVWHEDKGFRKCRILNSAILTSHSDYLLFTDGDCIPRKDFVANHLKEKEPGFFLSGGYFKLPMTISKAISDDDILIQKCYPRYFCLTIEHLFLFCENLIRLGKFESAKQKFSELKETIRRFFIFGDSNPFEEDLKCLEAKVSDLTV